MEGRWSPFVRYLRGVVNSECNCSGPLCATYQWFEQGIPAHPCICQWFVEEDVEDHRVALRFAKKHGLQDMGTPYGKY